jgi:hypothetical protein
MKAAGILWTILLLIVVGQCQENSGYVPVEGYVPDSKTAIKIAEAVLLPVYGKKKIEAELPLTAKLQDGVWTVGGTLRCSDGKGGMTTSCFGGVAVVKISKKDAKILYMIHGK